jgi:mono/diheme cytochrome c family protein
MVLMFSPLLAAPSTGHEIVLACVAAAFIGFGLISAFVLPARNPNFPGKGMPIYATIAVLFFVAMIASVLILDKDTKEATGAGATTTQAGQTTGAPTTPSSTTTSGSTTGASPTPTTTSSGGSATQGDATAGKGVFASAGCTGCHTLKAAGSTGTTGPNLDQLKPSFTAVVHQVTNGGGLMPAFKGQLTPTQINDVAAYVFTSTH